VDSAFPNDPNFSKQWAMNNTGQTGGKPDYEIFRQSLEKELLSLIPEAIDK
jgi:hypothetical protein